MGMGWGWGEFYGDGVWMGLIFFTVSFFITGVLSVATVFIQ